MIDLPVDRIAAAAGAEIASAGAEGYPERAVVDSRQVGAGDLFFGIPGAETDGGRFAADAVAAGCWGVVVGPQHAVAASEAGSAAWVLSSANPERSLQDLARSWRRELGCPLVGITGSTGKTSVKDITKALLPVRVHASPQNYNTEIGLPLALLAAPRETEVLVMEMAMRGLGQIEHLCEIAEPDVAAITNIGPVHLELLGTLEAIAAAKAEILQGLGARGRAVIPEDAEALSPHLHDQLITLSFGAGGDVFVERSTETPEGISATIGTPHGEASFELPFEESYNLTNTLCAVAIGVALGFEPARMAERTSRIEFSRLRGEKVRLREGIVLLNDCYNANPTSMRAAIDHLGGLATAGRKIAVLGGMAELGPEWAAYHHEVAARLRELGIGPLIGVGELAREYSPDSWVAEPAKAAELLVRELSTGDVALIKGSRAVGLELIADELRLALGEEER